MKFTIDSLAVSKALKIVAPAIQQNVVIPILESVLVEVDKSECTITATNLNLTISHKLKCESKDTFKLAIPFREFSNITSVIAAQPITIEDTPKQIVFSTGHKIGKAHDVNVFPTMQEFEPDFEMDADEEFMYHLQLATNCCTKDNLSVQFLNVCINHADGKIQILSSDRIQLFRYEQPFKKAFSPICVDYTFVKALRAIEAGKLSSSKKFLKIEDENTNILIRLSEEKFPDTSMLFTPYTHNFSIDRQELLSSLNKLMVFNSPLFDVHFLFNSNSIKLKFDDNEFDYHFEEELKADHSVEVEKIRLNGVFLKNMLSLMPETETVKLCIKDEKQYIHIDTDNDNLKFIIIPLFNN